MSRVAPSVYYFARHPLSPCLPVVLSRSLALSLCLSAILFFSPHSAVLSYLYKQNTLFIKYQTLFSKIALQRWEITMNLFEFFAVGHVLDGRPLRFDPVNQSKNRRRTHKNGDCLLRTCSHFLSRCWRGILFDCFDHALCHLWCRHKLSKVLCKFEFWIHQVHDDCVVHQIVVCFILNRFAVVHTKYLGLIRRKRRKRSVGVTSALPDVQARWHCTGAPRRTSALALQEQSPTFVHLHTQQWRESARVHTTSSEVRVRASRA